MKPQALDQRLKSLSQSHREISQLITRLAKLPAQPIASESADDIRLELGAEIHQSLKDAEEEFELLKQESEDITSGSIQRRDSEKDRELLLLVSQVGRLEEDLKLARSQFRRAQLAAKRASESARRKERELLFATVQEGASKAGVNRKKGQERFSAEEQTLNAANDVTAALRRTHQLMTVELERSHFAHETLNQSTAALNNLQTSYSTLDNLLSSSKSLISTLVSSQKSDTWYLETAFWLLVYVIAWLVFRRLVYGPIKYFLLIPTTWTLRLAFWIFQVTLGVITAIPNGLMSSSSQLSTASTSSTLRLSAQGPAPQLASNMAQQNVPEGFGGPKGASQKGGKEMEEEKIGEEVSMTDEVEQMVYDSRNGKAPHETVLRGRTADEAPNPKKRMWEETAQESNQPVKDEL